MPNWVDNYLTVKKDDLKYILNEKNEVDFEILIPMPDEIRNTESPCDRDEELKRKYGASNWYDWSVRNWGTKWNACGSTSIEEVGDDEVRITFETPWNYPEMWLYKLAKIIDFHLAWYEEQGYRGIITAEDGYLMDNFTLPEVEWIEDEDGNFYSSEDKEPFDWRDIVYDGQFEEMMEEFKNKK